MRLFPPRLAAAACLAVSAAAPARSQPPIPVPGVPQPAGVAAVEPCPPEPCPPLPCPPRTLRSLLCPPVRVGPSCAPTPAGHGPVNIRVLPSEVEFRRAPSCAPACSTPGCTTCAPAGRPTAANAPAANRAPLAAPQAMVTVPVQSYQYVPVTTLQAVPVTTFQTVPASTVGVTSQTFGVTGASFGITGQSFGASPFTMAAPAAAGVSDADLRALRMLLQMGTAQPRAGAEAAGAKGGCADAAAQFEELEKRLERLQQATVKNARDIQGLEGRVQSLESWRREREPAGAQPIPRSNDGAPMRQ